MIWAPVIGLIASLLMTEYAMAMGDKSRLDHPRELLLALGIVAYIVALAISDIKKAIKEHTDAVTTALRNHGSAGTLAGPDDDAPRPGK